VRGLGQGPRGLAKATVVVENIVDRDPAQHSGAAANNLDAKEELAVGRYG
jgi:hypothetical protein